MPTKLHCIQCDRTVAVEETEVIIKRGKNTYMATQDQCENCHSWFMSALVTSFPNIQTHGVEKKNVPATDES